MLEVIWTPLTFKISSFVFHKKEMHMFSMVFFSKEVSYQDCIYLIETYTVKTILLWNNTNVTVSQLEKFKLFHIFVDT